MFYDDIWKGCQVYCDWFISRPIKNYHLSIKWVDWLKSKSTYGYIKKVFSTSTMFFILFWSPDIQTSLTWQSKSLGKLATSTLTLVLFLIKNLKWIIITILQINTLTTDPAISTGNEGKSHCFREGEWYIFFLLFYLISLEWIYQRREGM